MKVLTETICLSLALFCFAGGTYMEYLPFHMTQKNLPLNKNEMLNDHNIIPWKLVWNDEFDGTVLNSEHWNILDDVSVDGNRIQDYNPENIEVAEGKLKIKTMEESSQGMPFTSGAVTTKGKVLMKYGKIEVRAKFPAGTGALPAIWLWNNQGEEFPEIDIVEIFGDQPGKVWSTIHYEVNGIYKYDSNLSKIPELSPDYHTFAIEWYPDRITFFVDGIPTYTSTTFIPDEDMYLYINTDVRRNWDENPNSTTVFPVEMLVDWVRYYQK